MNLDFFLFQKINSFALKCFWLDSLAIFLANYLPYILFISLLIFLLWDFKKYWIIVAKSILAGVIARLGFVPLFHLFWPRPRPFIFNSPHLLLRHANTPSFPSGHAAFFFALSTVIYFYNKKAGIIFFFASILLSFFRVFCGIHWPSDIIFGAIIGIFSGFVIEKLIKYKKGMPVTD